MRRSCFKKNCNNTTTRIFCGKCKIENTKVFIVIGPSCSGKSTLVKNRSHVGDLIIDFDLIYKAISGCELYNKSDSLLPFVFEIRNLIITMIGDVDGVKNAWIIRNKFKDIEIINLKKQFKATVIEIRPRIDVCKKRLLLDKNRPKNQINSCMSRIEEWFHHHPFCKPFSDEIITQ